MTTLAQCTKKNKRLGRPLFKPEGTIHLDHCPIHLIEDLNLCCHPILGH